MKLSGSLGALLLAIAANPGSAIELNVQDAGSIKSAASTIAYGLVKYYTGNVTNTPETIAILPPPHYWWQAGAMWGLLLDYYHFTGDSAYNAITTQALLSQVGPKNDYMVPLYALSEANDDQAFWGFSTMSAAEKGYPEPSTGGYTWLQLTENLWNTQVYRWDTTTCGGGLKWQIFDFNKGYFYKNSVSNGAFFQLSARLAHFTGNQTYLDWAVKSWEWSESVGLISPNYNIYDGTDSLKNCVDLNHIEWSYNSAIYLYGAAMLFDATNGAKIWADRTQGLLDASAFFFSPYDNATDVMYEYACEPIHTCNYDQFSFKGYLARFMWATTKVAPFTKDTITKLLTTSAQAAAKSCSGGRDGVTCGTKWYTGGWDGTLGVGQQMSALEAIQGLLIEDSPPPIRANGAKKQAPALAPAPTTIEVEPTIITSYVAPVETTRAPEPTKGQSTITPGAEPLSISTSVPPTLIQVSPESSTSEKPLVPIKISSSSSSRVLTSVVVAPTPSSSRSTSVLIPSPSSEIPTSPFPSSSGEQPTSIVVVPSSSSEKPTSEAVTLISTSTALTSLEATPILPEETLVAETPNSTTKDLTTAEPTPTSEEPEPIISSTEEPVPSSTSTTSSSSTISISSTTIVEEETTRSEEPTSTAISSATSSTTFPASSSVTSTSASRFVTSSTRSESESSREALTTSSTAGETPVPTRAPAESQTRVEATPSPSAPGSAGRRESVSLGMGMSLMIACLSALYFS